MGEKKLGPKAEWLRKMREQRHAEGAKRGKEPAPAEAADDAGEYRDLEAEARRARRTKS